MQVVLHPNKVLSTKTEPVMIFDEALADLSKKMLVVMYEKRGIGLAATQIGLSISLCVIDIVEPKGDPRVFVNPVITSQDNEVPSHEGCLSVPGSYADRPRFNTIKVQYQDLEGLSHEETMTGLMAIAMQHEVDHLNGKMFMDCFGPVKKRLVIDKYKKHVKQLSRQKD
jgi:peptide deformylase